MATLKAKRTIKRTNDRIKALGQLDAFHLRIEAVMSALTQDEFTLAETCHEICEIGVKIQKVSKLVRPLTVEGGKNNRDRNLGAKFQRHVKKNEKNIAWLDANCDPTKNGKHGYFSQYDVKVKAHVDKDLLTPRLRRGPNTGWNHTWLVPSKKWLEDNDK